MGRFFKSLFNVRKGEWPLTLLMLANYFILLVTYYFLKPARDSLFLVKVSSQMLPLVFIITAIVTAPVVSLYSRASKKMRLNRVINITTLILIINLFILRWLIQISADWVYYLFYTWVSIYGALTTAQFWLMANEVYDAGQAKRIFTLISLAGIIGAFSGGQLTSLTVTYLNVSTENLLFICMALLAVSMLLITLIWSRKSSKETRAKRVHRREKTKESYVQITKTIFRSRHLTLTVGIIAITMMVASFVDFQFKTVSVSVFSDKAALTSFLGKFYSWLSIGSLVIQIFFANRLIKLLGVGGLIMLLPIFQFLGSIALFIAPGLLTASLLRGSDGTLKYSVDKTGRELLFLPIPMEIKKRTKIFIDMFIDRWFRGFAGGLLLLCTLVLKLSVQQISLVVMGLLVIWIVLTVLMRREYVNSFRKAIERREIDFSQLQTHIKDKGAIEALINSLQSDNDRQVIYALEMLKSVKDKKIAATIAPLLNHKSAEVRYHALNILKDVADAAYLDQIRGMLSDPDVNVRCEAVHFISRFSEIDHQEEFNKLLNADNPMIIYSAIGCIARHGEKEDYKLINQDLIERVLSDQSDQAVNGRVQLATALGTINNPDYNIYLEKLIDDPKIEVVRAAVISVGRINKRTSIPWLIDHLSDRKLRVSVRQALASFGVGILGTLSDYLMDPAVPFQIRKNIPRVFTQIPYQAGVDTLTKCLREIEPFMKYYVVKALNSLRTKHSDLKFDRQELETALINETKEYYQIYTILYNQDNFSDTAAARLLRRTLTEKSNANLEIIFRLLGLVYPPNDIFYAYQGYVSGKKNLQVNAVEFLDNLLTRDLKRYILPIIEDITQDMIIQKAEELFRVGLRNREEALEILFNGRDLWLKCCAVYYAAELRSDKLMKLITEFKDSPDPLLAQTANLVLKR